MRSMRVAIECCGGEKGTHEAHSFVIVCQRVDNGAYSYFQCREDEKYKEQHWCCSLTCATRHAQVCITEHNNEQLLRYVPGVLPEPFVSNGYRFVLTYATPGPSREYKTSWCDTLNQAQKQACDILEQLTRE